MRRRIKLRVLDPRIGTTFPLPQHATTGSAGMDLRACIDAAFILGPGRAELISTGVSIFIEDFSASTRGAGGFGSSGQR